MNQPVLEGIYPYLVSPVDETGRVLEKPLRDLVSHLIDAGVHGLTPLGSTGEFFYLNREQKREIVRIVLDETDGRVPVVAGVSAPSVREACKEAEEYVALGVSGIVSALTSYFPLTQEAAGEYYTAVAKSVPCPVVLYNNPKFTGLDLSLELLEKLCVNPNICYYKDATGNTGKLLSIVNRLGDRLKIFSASAHIPVFVMMLGGVGWMAGPACVVPEACVCLYELCKAQKWEEALELQRGLWEINQVFQKYNLAACIKTGLSLQGFAVGDPILPNLALPDVARAEIQTILEKCTRLTWNQGKR